MCLVVVINVRDGYTFPYSENIPSLSHNLCIKHAKATILDVFYKDLKVHATAFFDVELKCSMWHRTAAYCPEPSLLGVIKTCRVLLMCGPSCSADLGGLQNIDSKFSFNALKFGRALGAVVVSFPDELENVIHRTCAGKCWTPGSRNS